MSVDRGERKRQLWIENATAIVILYNNIYTMYSHYFRVYW